MRKGLTALVTVVGILSLLFAPGARADDPSKVGSFSKPFREDAFKRPGTGGTAYYQDPRLTDNLGVIELEGLKNTRIFDPASNTWSQTGSMNYGRWYPSTVTLPDSKVIVAGGVTKLLKPLYTDAHDMSN